MRRIQCINGTEVTLWQINCFVINNFFSFFIVSAKAFSILSYSWIIFSSLFFCNENLMLVHKSGGLLFEKWKKMSQISVAIILSRWKCAFMCWGSVLDYSDSHLIEMEQWSAWKYSERERKASERVGEIEGRGLKKREKEREAFFFPLPSIRSLYHRSTGFSWLLNKGVILM